jgi:multidrug efflux pump subunit AcrA (membrane-fusion protein)
MINLERSIVKPVVIGLLTALAATACGSSPRTETGRTPTSVVGVSTSEVAVMDLPTRIEAGGIVRSGATAQITSQVIAPIQAVHVRAGDRVKQGQPLVTLDAREVTAGAERARAASVAAVEAARAAESRMAAAEAALRLAVATHGRIKGLYDKRSATPQELDQATAALDAADAQVKTARAESASAVAAQEAARAASDAATVTRSYAVLAAPFEGIVADRLADPGSLAAPGSPLLVIEQSGTPRLEVRLDDSSAARIAVGQRADVHLDTSDSPDWIATRVVEVGRAEPASHSVLVKLELPARTSVRTGSFGRARFATGARRTLVVPSASVIRRAGLTFVFTIDADAQAHLRPVVIGAVESDRTEVLSGVAGGDAVVLDPPPTLTDGARVTRQPPGVAGRGGAPASGAAAGGARP